MRETRLTKRMGWAGLAWAGLAGLCVVAGAQTRGAAEPAAMVRVGHARFTVLTSRLIRMEWSAEDKFEDRPSLVFVNRRMTVPQFQSEMKGGVLALHTDDLDLRYDSGVGTKFDAKNLSIKVRVGDTTTVWHPGDASTGNLLGTTRTLDGAVGEKTKEPMEPGLVSRDGWSVVDDSLRPLFDSDDFSFAKGEESVWPWVVARGQTEAQDLYFFGYGHDYRAALGDFVKVAGRIPLPPKFAFGAWWSRYWAYSDQDLLQLVHDFKQNSIPLDVLVIDMDWHKTLPRLTGEVDQSGNLLGWSGYTWDSLLFPHPKELLDELHREGTKITLNLHPASGVQPWEGAYPAMARAVGIDPATKKYVPFNGPDKTFSEASMRLVHHPLEAQGVDFWWLDWQQQFDTKIPDLSVTWWLNYVHFTDQEREGKRPLLFHRWGGLGNHRYEIGFSGDTHSTWDSLAFQPWFTATAANVGYAYWSHDIGGHIPGAVDAEMYTRWVQYGVMSPIFRTHTTKAGDAERRPWAYPEPYSDVMKKSYEWRHEMEPYLYTEARRTYDTGVAFVHPLYYDWPEQDEAYKAKTEYAFGESLIAAPVVKPVDATSKMVTMPVWVPPGEWMETTSGRHLQGPAKVERSFTIDEMPMYVKPGAIIPTKVSSGSLGLTIYPLQDGQTSTYTVYEDSDQGERYQHGEGAWTKITATQTGDDLVVAVAPVRGEYAGMAKTRSWRIMLPADWAPASVTVNGVALKRSSPGSGAGWRYEGNSLTTIVDAGSHATAGRVEIRIRRTAGSLAQRGLLDGFTGAIARLRTSLDLLNRSWPTALPPNVLIEAAQTGDRIGYVPDSARTELATFRGLYAQARTEVDGLAKKAKMSDTDLEAHVAIPGDREKILNSMPLFRAGALEASALLKDGQPAPLKAEGPH